MLFTGLLKNSLKSLQMIQNSAARVLTETKRREHITLILKSLHWLPISHRIDFSLVFWCSCALALSRSLSLSLTLSLSPQLVKADDHPPRAEGQFFLAPVAKCLLMVVLLGLCKCYKEFGLDMLHLKSALMNWRSTNKIELNFKALVLVFKSLKGVGPNYIHEMFKRCSQTRCLRSQHKQLLLKPTVGTKQGEAAFSHYGVHLWKQLPETIKNAPTITIF
ncbi:hypothetical protein N1851_034041 [Merluccius polli]|uniref:Uncharacterized protein n=1 Tax=Merluccius polli TaxID=89951 RepID=A0AA47NMY8_MERPO|nr:hypothetical protein N1851_034041 [Merluccius polli]